MLGSLTADILAGVVTFVGFLYVYFTWHFDYWKKRGVPFVKPLPFLGNTGGSFTGKVPFYEVLNPCYDELKKHGCGGIFQAKTPTLLVCDPEIIKQVLTKDFSNFHDRGQPFDEENDPLSANLFNLSGPRWKNLRARMSPTFTSGKMKLMFPLITDISDEMKDLLKTQLKTKNDVEMKDILTRYATDVIGSCGFGINCNSLKDPQSEFHQMGREVFKRNILFIIRFFLISIHPIFAKLLPFKWLFSKLTNFFINLMKETVEYREKNNIQRNDFVNLMMQLREDTQTETDRENHIEFTHGVMTAQAFLFFLAGLDSIANTVGFCLHELAKNPELQRQAAREVREVLKKHDGKMTYEAAQQMHLIDRIIAEGLRKWVPVGFLTRKPTAVGQYKIPETDIKLDQKAMIFIPVWQLHQDPQYYPEPEKFDPDRFTEEAKRQRHPYAYLPFGEGPRVCIAQRFALLEMKVCLASLIEAFSFTFSPKSDPKPVIDTGAFSPTPKAGFVFTLQERPAGEVE